MYTSPYDKSIRERLGRLGLIGKDARHVEAWMRVENGTLDALSSTDFDREVETAARCIDEGGVEMSEKLAVSYGL